MECKTAVEYINTSLWFTPGWDFEASDWDRFDGAVLVKVTFPAARSEHDCWPDYPEMIPNGQHATRAIIVSDCSNIEELEMRVFLGVCLPAMIHEGREFFRSGPTGEAPFHPHKHDGMNRWEHIVSGLGEQQVRDLLGSVREDLAFGMI